MTLCCHHQRGTITDGANQGQGLQDIVDERRFQFAGHILQMAPERPAEHQLMEEEEASRRRSDWQHFVKTYMATGVS